VGIDAAAAELPLSRLNSANAEHYARSATYPEELIVILIPEALETLRGPATITGSFAEARK